MKARKLIAILMCWVSVIVATGGQSKTAQDALEAARKTAVVDGDLAAAIKQYQAIVAQYEKTDRFVAAQALLRMAECYEKSGSVEAQRVYARVLRDFPEQAAAVAAAREAMRPMVRGPAADQTRLAWTLPEAEIWVRSNVSPDGRYLAIAALGGGLMLHDVTSGADRVVARPTEPDTWFAAVAFSRDNQRLAYEVRSSADGTGRGLRTINLGELGLPRPTVLTPIPAQPCDWSPDGRWVVARLPQQSLVVQARRNPVLPWQLALISVADGSVQVLKGFDARHGTRHAALFSPDGRYLAFEVPENEKGARDILVMSVDGRAETRAVAAPGDDGLIGWAPDGNGVLFHSARGSGAPAIWLQPMESGSPRGAAELVRAQGTTWPLGLTAAGALFFGVDNGPGVGVKQAFFDPTTGVFQSPPEDVPASFVRSSRRPRWSPDGRFLGFISMRGDQGGDVFIRRETESGLSREVPLEVGFRNQNRNLWYWAPDAGSIITVSENPDPAIGLGLYRTDLSTGRSTLFVSRDVGNQTATDSLEWSADMRTFTYSYVAGPGKYVRVARDLATGTEQEVQRRPANQSADGSKLYRSQRRAGGVTVVVEQDAASGVVRDLLQLTGNTDWYLVERGQAMVAMGTDANTNQDVILHYTIATGAKREIFRALAGQPVSIGTFTPDQRSFFVQHKPKEGSASLFWWVPTDGRPSRLLKELSMFEDVGWDFHPDGRRVALQVNYPRTMNDQVYVLENFLPFSRR